MRRPAVAGHSWPFLAMQWLYDGATVNTVKRSRISELDVACSVEERKVISKDDNNESYDGVQCRLPLNLR